MIKTVLILLACSMLSVAAMCQSTGDKIQTFEQARHKDFTKLIGGLQEGFRLIYDKDKTLIEASRQFQIPKNSNSPLYLQATANLGATTDLTGLFDPGVLPTYSGALTAHYVLKGLSTHYYDGKLPLNLTTIQNAADLSTMRLPNPPKTFSYTDSLKAKVDKGTIDGTPNKKFYTAIRFNFLSLTLKHDYAKYTFFDSTAIFTSQLTNPQYRTWSMKVNYTYFFGWNKVDADWHPWRPDFVYLTFGINRGLSNNIAVLKQQTVQTITSQYTDPVSGTVRQVVDSKNAYKGQYLQYVSTTPSVELIVAPFSEIAVFMNAETSLIDSSPRERFNLHNTWAWAGGIYFYGKGQDTSRLNLGVFYKRAQDPLTDKWVGTFQLRTSIPFPRLFG